MMAARRDSRDAGPQTRTSSALIISSTCAEDDSKPTQDSTGEQEPHKPTPKVLALLDHHNEDENRGEGDVILTETLVEAEKEKQRFREAMVRFQEATSHSSLHMELDLDSNFQWENVLEAVNEASELYQNVPGVWGKIRKGLRRFGKNNAVFTAWAEVLPSQSQYFSILCGGLKLIFGAAARLQDLRSEICDVLVELPGLLANTHKASGLFKLSQDLQLCGMQLYVATIATLHHILKWYTEKALKKFAKSLFKQASYQTELTDKIQAVRDASARFETATKLCSYEYIVGIHEQLSSHREVSQQNHDQLLQDLSKSREVLAKQSQLLSDTVNSNTRSTQRALNMLARKLREESNGSINSVEQAKLEPSAAVIPRSIQPHEGWTPEVSTSLSFAPRAAYVYYTSSNGHDEELQNYEKTNPRPIEALSSDAKARLLAIMHSPLIKDWISTLASSLLFVNCNTTQSSDSPSTTFCAKLAESITQRSERTISLTFFCAEHARKFETRIGPPAMLQSFIRQLLAKYPDVYTREYFRDLLSRNNGDLSNIRLLCGIFESLVLRLPREFVVFGSIDSINIYEEDESTSVEMENILRVLIEIAQRASRDGRVFKLVMMCAWNSHALYKAMPNQNKTVLWIPAKVSSRKRLTTAAWDEFVAQRAGL